MKEWDGKVRASNNSESEHLEVCRSKVLRVPSVKFSLAVALISISVSGFAQQNQFKVKPSHDPEMASRKSVPIGKTTVPTASAANARSLQSVEHETARSVPARSATKKAPPLKLAKDQSNPPINFASSSGGGKNAGLVSQSANPYKGRLKQKNGRQ
jgi:hypothetical protein